MEQNQYIVAFEIGSSKIVGAIAEKSQSGMVSVIHLVEEKLNNCVRYGIVQNVENVKSSINRMLKNLEDRAAGRITEIYVGMSGRSLHSVVKENSRAIDATKPITPETVDSIIREVAREPVKETLTGKTIVFSESSGDETAMTLEDEGHGLFTYYLLKKLQETNGDVTYGDLADYINRNVKKDAFLINEKPQTPVVATSPAVQNTWKTMKLK